MLRFLFDVGFASLLLLGFRALKGLASLAFGVWLSRALLPSS